VSRKAFAEIPPRVEYSLTPLGRSLLPILQQLHNWAVANSESLLHRQEEPASAETEPVPMQRSA